MLGDQQIIVGRYFNSNYQAMVIVAVISEGIDWAAYANGADHKLPEREAAKFVADYGCKLPFTDAKHFFPEIKLPYRR